MIKQLKRTARRVMNLVSLTAYHLSGKDKQNVRKFASLKEKYSGKRCFVICNGPSLRPEDLTKIHEHGDVSIAMNMIANVYDKTSWRPTILLATDACVFHKANRTLVETCEAGLKCYQKTDFLRTKNVDGDIIYVSQKHSTKLLDSPKFSTDSSKVQYTIGTTAYEAIEWAFYLGCREIYFLGCDMSYAVNLNRDGSITYNESGQNHFYAKDKDFLSIVKPNPTWQLQIAYDAAEKFSRQLGFRIYNATRGGKLESFERVDFDSLF